MNTELTEALGLLRTATELLRSYQPSDKYVQHLKAQVRSRGRQIGYLVAQRDSHLADIEALETEVHALRCENDDLRQQLGQASELTDRLVNGVAALSRKMQLLRLMQKDRT